MLKTEEERIAHLLRRAGFGAGQRELACCLPLGLNATVDLLLDFDSVDEGFDTDVWELQNENGQLNAPAVASWWIWRMVKTNTPLREKLTLFWHDHFACSGVKVQPGPLLHEHNNLLRAHCVNDFRTLLSSVARDTTMLLFLDGRENVMGNPNENFARELMELYTMGIGNYTENDIQEAARAFTGWSFSRPSEADREAVPPRLPTYRFRPAKHDSGEKTVLGVSGNLSGDDVIDILLDQPATAHYITSKLWEWFAYPEPEPHVIDSLAASFRQSNFSIAQVLRDIFTADEFYSDKAERALVKSPADFVIPILRAVDLPTRLDESGARLDGSTVERKRWAGVMLSIYQRMGNMGMQLLFPPTVAGWDGGLAWLNSATMLERIRFAEIFAGKQQLPVYREIGEAGPDAAEEITRTIAQLLDAPLPDVKLGLITQDVRSILEGAGNAGKRGQQTMYTIARLTFACPEYQYC